MARSFNLSNKSINWTLHLIGWIFVVIIPLYVHNAYGGGSYHRLYSFYLHTFAAGVVFYFGYIWLVPRYFLQDKKAAYFLILIGFILVTYFLTYLFDEYVLHNPAEVDKLAESLKRINVKGDNPRPPMQLFNFISHVTSSLLLSGFAIGLGVMDKLKENEKKQKEMEKEKLHSELAFLKNQVSPHFFFNTLNNIYSLIGIDGPTAQDSVLKLSKLMRYLLYESENGETQMSHEIDFMHNYIDLMKLRLSPKVDLKIDFPKDFPDFSIPPLLFISFIENAFKHGISHRDPSFINIKMEIDSEQIRFIAENSLGNSARQGDMQHSGIGLENIRKRLGLLFPGKHELKIERTETAFIVELVVVRHISIV